MTDITRTAITSRRDGAANHLLQLGVSHSYNRHPSAASSSYSQPGPVSSGLATSPTNHDQPRLLLIDHSTADGDSLKVQIERATALNVRCASSFADGLKVLCASGAKVEMVTFTINHDYDPIIRFIKTVNRLSGAGRIPRPFLLALSMCHQEPSFAANLDQFGVQILLRKYPEQIVETVKKLHWQSRKDNGLPMITIERRAGQIVGVRVHHRGVTERFRIGPRLRALTAYLVIHRKTEHSTQALAEALAISPASLKEYLKRLRTVWDRIRFTLGTPLRGKDVFWTGRMSGGFVHSLKVNAEVEDSEDFFLPEQD